MVSSVTFFWSTSSSSSVAMYVNAIAPLRKCMSGVAGTPVIESPKAPVYTSVPFERTCTMTALRWFSAIELRTMFSIAETEGVSAARARAELDQSKNAARTATMRMKRP